jgi:hypothetical protein
MDIILEITTAPMGPRDDTAALRMDIILEITTAPMGPRDDTAALRALCH